MYISVCVSLRFMDTMVNTVGHRTAELSLQFGLMYSPSDALKIGLVDQVVPEEKVLSTATETMTQFMAIPGQNLHFLTLMTFTEHLLVQYFSLYIS